MPTQKQSSQYIQGRRRDALQPKELAMLENIEKDDGSVFSAAEVLHLLQELVEHRIERY